MPRTPPPHAFVYVHCEVPVSMTLDEFRRAHNRSCRAAELAARRRRRAALVVTLRRCVGGRP